jgi:hypothetical protein
VTAVDGDGRPSINTATVRVNVYRNNNNPFFTGTIRQIDINEDLGTGTSVFQFFYSDVDPDVRFLSLFTLRYKKIMKHFWALQYLNGKSVEKIEAHKNSILNLSCIFTDECRILGRFVNKT